ncbi:MAG TPA: L,D-transpeptidase [Kofleriaceae bacterium]|nr:L,D-transpeptidase [Kofleriaceae bacterium]
MGCTSRLVVAGTLIACSGSSPTRTAAPSPAPSVQASVELRPPPAPVIDAGCDEPAIVVEAGHERAAICPGDAAGRGLTVVDLRDAWTPSLFAGADGQVPSFRARYLAMASEHDARGAALDGEDALGELYGVLPSLAIARARLADEPRHLCHDFIASEAIASLARPYSQDHKDIVAASDRMRVFLEAQLERERVRRGLPDLDALARVPALAATYARWKPLAELHAGIVAAQKHYVCEGFLAEADADGSLTWRTGNATELFQRRNFLMPNERLDPETRDALALDSRELDFRLALRILRERVVDATGLIEDGTAGSGPQPILGRQLDPANMRAARGNEQPLANAAPDLISAATEAAARQLGWLGWAQARDFLARHPGGARVAIALPAPPAYHGAAMSLRAEIDRGDVWYDEVPIPRKIAHRPTLIVYADDHGTARPLIRWPTTIGGWADQRTAGGGVVKKWKESDVGAFVWRDLYAAPTWLAPKTTPDRDLVTNLYNGHYALKTAVLGPGPHAAYGMTLLVHHQVFKKRDGSVRFDDNGIGTHGSASVTSIVNGTSHGCHRLYNQLAVRLADFLLRHRQHIVRGEQPEVYRRVVSYKTQSFIANINTRGFLYEMTPPIPVNVLPGNILSARKVPPRDAAPARPD